MSSGDCPPWEYANHPGRIQVGSELRQTLKAIHQNDPSARDLCLDTRSLHGRAFRAVTPPGFGYYAGNYRGAKFPGLETRPVYIGSHEGAPAENVEARMNQVAQILREGLKALDDLIAGGADRNVVIIEAIRVACNAFVISQIIHPYLNGNGHMGRFIALSVLGRYGIRLRDWPVDPRPADPPYTAMIAEYRAGKRHVLEEHLLKLVFESSRAAASKATGAPAAPKGDGTAAPAGGAEPEKDAVMARSELTPSVQVEK